MAHVERAWNRFVGDDPTEFERRSGGRERAYAERVEKIRDEADRRTQHAGLRSARGGARRSSLHPIPAPRVKHRERGENGEQEARSRHAVIAAPPVEP